MPNFIGVEGCCTLCRGYGNLAFSWSAAVPASLNSDLSDEIHMYSPLFHVFFFLNGAINFSLRGKYWPRCVFSLTSIIAAFSSARCCGESVGWRGFTQPRGYCHSLLEGGRTSFPWGMCVDCRNPDHVMARSPCSPSLTSKVNNIHLAQSSATSLGIELDPFWFNEIQKDGC